MTTEKDTCLEVNYKINNNVKTPEVFLLSH